LTEINYWIKKHRTRISGVFGILCLVVAEPSHSSLLYGFILIVAGESLRIWSSGHIHKNQILTVTGPYSLSRNPLYVGSFILGTGFIIAMGVIWLAVVSLFFFVSVYWFTIRWEEDKLARAFPDGWEAYKKSVPRFLPFLNFPEYHPGEFSWAQVSRYKEVQNASVVLVIYFILWAKAFLTGG